MIGPVVVKGQVQILVELRHNDIVEAIADNNANSKLRHRYLQKIL